MQGTLLSMDLIEIESCGSGLILLSTGIDLRVKDSENPFRT